jgi:glucose-6-phosphate dehydrogenase assembly protein OpcA
LNWARSSAWRNALANTFDNQDRLSELKKAQTIKICYATNKHDSNVHSGRQAIYLQAWLATQLKWKFEDIKISKDKTLLTYQRQKNDQVTIELKSKHHESLAAGEIIELDIESPNKQFYSLCRKEGQPQICVHVSTTEACELPCNLTIPNWKKGSQIVTEVFYQNPSQHYLHMLQLLAKIDWRSL